MSTDPKQNALVEQRRQIDRLKKANDDLTRKLAESEAARDLADEALTVGSSAAGQLRRQLAEAVEVVEGILHLTNSATVYAAWEARARAFIQKQEPKT